MSANLILEHIFQMEDRIQYQQEIMKCLMLITSRPKISNDIAQFFSQVDNTADVNSHCNFEMQVIDPKAPLFSKTENNNFKIMEIHDFENG